MTTKFDTYTRAVQWIDHIFLRAARIVEGDCYESYQLLNGTHDFRKVYEGREWFSRERNKYPLHPAVHKLMLTYKPDDWQQLLLEWPHKSESDPNRLAYTRDERAGEQDRQVVTTIGKYLRRHFKYASDDHIRDIVAQHTYGGDIDITTNMAEMVDAVIEGPASCMSKSGLRLRCADGEPRHPYAVYDPSLGWGMAVRKDGDSVMGRCLVWRGDYDGDADYKCFVRSYKRERGEHSHSGTDEAIESWLKSKGYVKCSEWPDGTPIMEYALYGGGYLMPYIDGGTQHVDEETFTINSYGDLEADNTDGTVHNGSDICSHCGRRYNSEDEGIWVGVYEDEHVCGNCEDEYTYAYSRRGDQYYIPNDRAIYVNEEYYDLDYLSDNGIVELANGDYEHIDNTIYIDSEDAYYHVDDRDICYAEDAGEYDLKHNCWQCAATDKWYTDDTDYVEIDGEMYHPDHAPEVEAEDDNTETN